MNTNIKIVEDLLTKPNSLWCLTVDERYWWDESGWQGFESREPGSVYAANIALRHALRVVQSGQPINASTLRMIHLLMSCNVQGVYRFSSDSRSEAAPLIPGTYRLAPTRFFIHNNQTDYKFIFGLDGKSGELESFRERMFNKDSQSHLHDLQAMTPGFPIISAGSKQGLQNQLYISITNSHPSDINEQVNTAFEKYSDKISQCTAEDDIIHTILELVQTIEIIHPFSDGNLRTCYCLMHCLLIQNGLKPAILNDPNCIDSTPLVELVKIVKTAIDEFNDTWTYGEYFNSFSLDGDPLVALTNPETIISSSDYTPDIDLAAFSQEWVSGLLTCLISNQPSLTIAKKQFAENLYRHLMKTSHESLLAYACQDIESYPPLPFADSLLINVSAYRDSRTIEFAREQLQGAVTEESKLEIFKQHPATLIEMGEDALNDTELLLKLVHVITPYDLHTITDAMSINTLLSTTHEGEIFLFTLLKLDYTTEISQNLISKIPADRLFVCNSKQQNIIHSCAALQTPHLLSMLIDKASVEHLLQKSEGKSAAEAIMSLPMFPGKELLAHKLMKKLAKEELVATHCLFPAVGAKETETIQYLTNKGIPIIEYQDHDGNHALHHASAEMVHPILDINEELVPKTNYKNQTALHTAAQSNIEKVKELSSLRYSNLAAADQYGNVALHYASSPEMVAYLANDRALMHTNENGDIPLHTHARDPQSTEITQAICEEMRSRNIDVFIPNRDGLTVKDLTLQATSIQTGAGALYDYLEGISEYQSKRLRF